MLANYSRTDDPLNDLRRACDRAQAFAHHGLNDRDLTHSLGLLSDRIQRFRCRHHPRGYMTGDVEEFLEEVGPLIKEVEERDNSFTSHSLAKVLE